MAYLNVVKIEDALIQMKARFSPQNEVEIISLDKAMGRYLSESIYSKESLPSFRRSMVDGYAVSFDDTIGASEQSPIVLKICGKVEMGMENKIIIEPGSAAYVPTGAEIPAGGDSMVMVEHAEVIGPDIVVYKPARKGEHVVEVGDDVKAGELILTKGTKLSTKHTGILASLGFADIRVQKKLKAAVISTGDEIVDIDTIPSRGQVRDCNLSIIKNVLESCGCEIALAGRAVDNFEELKDILEEAVQCSDIVLLSGGSSAGKKDMTQIVIDSFTSEPNVFIHGLAIKPGKPTIVGEIDKRAIIGLPGHPAACFITMKALVEPFIDSLFMKEDNTIKCVPCISGFQLYASSGRDVYQLVELVNENNLLIANAIYGKSGMVSSMANSNAYVIIPMNCEGVNIGDSLLAYLL